SATGRWTTSSSRAAKRLRQTDRGLAALHGIILLLQAHIALRRIGMNEKAVRRVHQQRYVEVHLLLAGAPPYLANHAVRLAIPDAVVIVRRADLDTFRIAPHQLRAVNNRLAAAIRIEDLRLHGELVAVLIPGHLEDRLTLVGNQVRRIQVIVPAESDDEMFLNLHGAPVIRTASACRPRRYRASCPRRTRRMSPEPRARCVL